MVCCVYPVYPYLGQLSASPNGWLVGLLYYCGYHVCLTLGDPGRFRWFTSCKTKLKAAQPLVIVVGSIVQFDEAWKTYATTASFVVFFLFWHIPMFLGQILLNPDALTCFTMANSIFSSSNTMDQPLLTSDRNLPPPTSSLLSNWNGIPLRRPKYLDLNLGHFLGSFCVF